MANRLRALIIELYTKPETNNSAFRTHSVNSETPSRAGKNPITAKRISNIIKVMTYEMFTYAARGFYETHKMLFTLLMALKIQLANKDITHKELLTFIKGWLLGGESSAGIAESLDLKFTVLQILKW